MKPTTDETNITTLYEKFLGKYWDILNKSEYNPYMSLGKQLVFVFRPKYLKYFSVSMVRFMQLPNTIRQELVGCDLMINELSKLSNSQLDSMFVMNEINLQRLRRRHLSKYVIVITVASVGLYLRIYPSLETDYLISLSQNIVVVLIICAISFSLVNSWILFPKIGLIKAFADIMKTEKARRQLPPDMDPSEQN